MPPEPAVIPNRPRFDGAPSIPLGVDDFAPTAARRFAAAILVGKAPAEHVADVELCVSELVTNACAAARDYATLTRFEWSYLDTPIHIGVLATARWTRLDVRDPDPVIPVPPDPAGADLLGESGRGLKIVDALAAGHWYTARANYKITHALIALPGVRLTDADLVTAGYGQ